MAMQISPESLEKLSRANRIASNVYSLDAILRVLSYSGLLGAEMLTELNAGKSTPLAAYLMELFSKLTDARFINRVGALPAMLESAFAYANEKGEPDLLGKLGRIMTWSMVIYSPIEHLWLLSTFKPKVINIDSNWWSMLSCRVWAVYVLADLLGTHIKTREATRAIEEARKSKEGTPAERRRRVAKLLLERKYLHLWTSCALTDLVMAVNWSLPSAPVSNKAICAVGIYGGFANLWLKWLRSRPQRD